jgi:hypothetical protein
MITHTLIRQYRDESGVLIQGSSTVTDDTSLNTSISIPHSTVDHEVDWLATRANLKALMFKTDQIVDIYVNDVHSGSPTNHIALTAGQEINWGLAADGLAACPLGSASATVTSLRISTSTILVLTQVVVTTPSQYDYSSFTGPAPYIGQSIVITGFATSGNNVTATVTAVDPGVSFTVATTTQANETHSGAGVGATVNDAQVEIRGIAHQGH